MTGALPGPRPAARPPRHARRPRLPDLRPLDRIGSIKVKLGVLVASTVTLGVVTAWLGLRAGLPPLATVPLALAAAMAAVSLLARGMTSPLREMTAAARAMAGGDWSRRVRATSRDEVGQLAEAFNTMAEDLAHQDSLRRETVANVSHELRTPVAALQAQLENMVDGVTEPSEPALRAALAQTERLGRLVGFLLDLSRIEAGVVDLDVADVPLAEFLDEAVVEVVPVAAPRGVTFAVEVPPDLSVEGDRERLHQVVANLLHNAVRHSPEDGTVTLSARAEDDRVVLDVVDQGPGIPAADRRRVFERFTRGSRQAAEEPATGGTGLGLAIVRWAVQLHGGSVAVVDSPGGATLRVRLPRRQPDRDDGTELEDLF